jgi:hypothetical protein
MKKEVAAVPTIVIRNILRSGICIRFFDECLHFPDTTAVKGSSRADVTVFSCGIGRMNAESDNVALRSSFGRISTCISEIRRVANEMVGRQHQYQRRDRVCTRAGQQSRLPGLSLVVQAQAQYPR